MLIRRTGDPATLFRLPPTVLASIAALVVTWALPHTRGLADDPEPTGDPSFSTADIEFFEKEIRPLLARRCFECHSGKSDALEGGLRLDSRAAVLAGGDSGPAIVPGDPSSSMLIGAVRYDDVYQMPPDSKLPDAEIALLEQWVRRGAPWPSAEDAELARREGDFDLLARRGSHWCWQAVRAVKPPVVERSGWPSDPLDHFILARLEAAGIAPSLPADKRTLIRRAYFDLTGLPPSPSAVEVFAADDSPEAFQHVVDDLLDSPHFGERWARHWMDLVRYAETYGHEFDYPIPHASEYRDYLIRAFNADVPYDSLIREHIAGDLLDEPRLHPERQTNESVIGTGFWWLGEATHAPVDVRGDAAGRLDNQIDVMGKSFLGLTIGCARCHDHKFDAISTADYYALWGFLKSSHRHEAFLDPARRIADAVDRLASLQQEGSTTLLAGLNGSAPIGQQFATWLLAAAELRRAVGPLAATTGEVAPDSAPDSDSNVGPASDAVQRIRAVAQKYGLPVDRLTHGAALLDSADLKKATHPLHVWGEVVAGEPESRIRELRERLAKQQADAESFRERYTLFADFSNLDGWFRTGAAFDDARNRDRGAAPVGAPATASGSELAVWDSNRESPQLARVAMVDSGRWSGRAQGVLRSPTFEITHKNIHYRVRGQGVKIRLIVDGYFMDTYNALLFRGFAVDVNTDGEFAWVTQSQDVGRYLGHHGHLEIIDHGDGEVEIDAICFSDAGPPPDRWGDIATAVLQDDEVNTLADLAAAYGRACDAALAALGSSTFTDEQAQLLNLAITAGILELSPKEAGRLAELRTAWQKVATTMPAPQRVLALADGSPQNARLYIRGNHRTPGSEVPRRFLDALSDEHLNIPAGSGRLELAERIADPDNPLTARVMVNRLWHHLFGRGIVASVDNFGVLGQPPTHPELLDDLAARFVDAGWSIKHMLRTIMLSRTYQMSSAPRPDAAAADPQNLLLHRQRIRRLEGEALRDTVLAVSGRLDRQLFGPSVPVHITPFMQGRGRPGRSGPLDGAGRRSIYTEVRRNFLPPMMLAFDTPIPFNSVGRRNVSNVPAQALILMNDPFVVEQARLWAERVIAAEDSPADRIHRLYLEAFARPPSDTEHAAAVAFLDQQARQLGLSPDAALNDVRPWSDLCHVLFNVKEFVFIN